MIDDVKADAENKMKKSIEALKRELNGIRTGRASAGLLEPLKIEYYGTPTPLQQIAAISVPEARPVRIPASSRLNASMDFFILFSASALTSSIISSPVGQLVSCSVTSY